MILLAPVSTGELLDKLSILYIKQKNIDDVEKLKHVNREIHLLESIVHQHRIDAEPEYKHYMARLAVVNNDLWNYEDTIRELTAKDDTGADFIQTAQHIHRTNDRRMRVKAQINAAYNSSIVEVKSYKE